jgi:hypothetical protein
MEKQKKAAGEAGAGRRLMYVKMRLGDLKDEMTKLKAERETLMASRGPRKAGKGAKGKGAKGEPGEGP